MSRRMDYHMHTRHSFDGEQSVAELARRMLALGADECCLTEHYDPGHPEPGVDRPIDWDAWFAEIAEARAACPGLILRAGIEIGDHPPRREESKRLLDTLPLDFRLLSLHLVDGVDCYDAEAYYTGRTRAEACRAYAAALADSALAWEDFDSFAHIGYVGRYAPWPDSALRFDDAPEELDALLRRLVGLGKALEVNSSTLDSLGCPMPHPSILRRYIELGGEDFTFGSDSHRAADDYRGIERAKELVRSLGGRWQLSFDRRRPARWPI